MKKVLVLVIALLVACAPMSFAAYDFCGDANSDNYWTAAGGKLGCGIENAAFGWLEIFNQPRQNENAWEGIGRGFVHAIARTLSGVLQVATFIIPDAKIPTPTPADPFEMWSASSSK